MAVGEIFTGVFIGILQLLILTVAGFILAKLSPLDPVGERKFSLAVFYLLLPLFCIIELSKSVNITENVLNICFLIISFTCVSIVSGILGFIYAKLSGVDLRSIWSFVIVSTFGSVTAFPAIIATSLCEPGGLLGHDKNCHASQGYSLMGLLMLNIYLWAVAPILISRDKFLCYHIRRKICLVKEFYPSLAAFMKDTDFTHFNAVQKERHADIMITMTESEEDSTLRVRFVKHEPVEKPHDSLDDEGLIEYSLQMNMDSTGYNEFKVHFETFLTKIHPKVFEKMWTSIPRPVKPLPISFCYIASLLASPPIIACFAGILLGAIPGVAPALFSDTSKQIFMKTVTNLSVGAIPTLVMLLGAKLSNGFQFTNTVNLRMKDLIALVILKLIIIPLIGIGFMEIAHKILSNENDRVLEFIMYSFWNVPPSVLMISTFVMIGYYSKEIGILQFWTNSLSAITMPVMYVIYFSVFPIKNT